MIPAILQTETFSEPQRVQRPTLADFLKEAMFDKERLTATYEKQIGLAVVPMEDVELIENLKSCLIKTSASDPRQTGEVMEQEEFEAVTQIEILPNKNHGLAILEKLLDFAATRQEPMILTYQRKLFIVVVPIAEEALMEEIEDCIDRVDIEESLKETGSTSLSQLKRELGLWKRSTP